MVVGGRGRCGCGGQCGGCGSKCVSALQACALIDSCGNWWCDRYAHEAWLLQGRSGGRFTRDSLGLPSDCSFLFLRNSPIIPDDWESQGWDEACRVAPTIMYLPGHGPARGLAFPSSAPRSCFSSFPVLSTPGKTLFAIISQRAGCPCTDVRGFPASGTGSGRAEAPSEKLPSDSVSSHSALSRAVASGATGEGHHSVLLAVSLPPHLNAGPLWALFSTPWG